ncbi:MAG: hypothetical protein QM727_02215 [Niabella sp.]
MIFELLLLILVWSLLNSMLQYAAGNNLWPLIIVALTAALFCYTTYPIAIEQSVPVLKKLPEDPLWLQRITVFILAELLFRWFTVNAALRSALGYPVKKWELWFQYVPLPGLPAALFLFQVMLFYEDVNTSFDTLAIVYAIAASLVLLLGGMVLRRLLPNREHRLELAQILILITAATTCILSVNVQFDQLGDTADKVADYRPFAVLVLLVVLVGALGYVWPKVRVKFLRDKK